MRATAWSALAAFCLVLIGAVPAPGARAEDAAATPPNAGPAEPPSRLPTVNLPEKPILEPKAMAILKAMGDRLAAAHSMSFTALATYESPAVTGQPLAYTSLYEVALQRPDPDDLVWLHDAVTRHARFTGSTLARSVLSDWPRRSAQFTKIMPTDYQKVLEATRMAKAEGRDVDSAIMEATRG